MTSSENNTIILKTLKKEKITEEKKKNIEKSPPHLKFNTQEDQEFGSLERRSSNSKDCEELKGIQIIVQNSEINLVSDINTIEEHILNNNQS